MIFLQLITRSENSDSEIFINPQNINYMRYARSDDKELKTTIYFNKEHSVTVKETIFEINEMLREII